MTDPSGSHLARKRVAAAAELSRGFRAPAPGREERLDVPPDRPSEPPPSWRTVRMLAPAVLVLLSAAATAATLYATYTSRLNAVEEQSQQVATTLAAVEAASRTRDESLSDRVTAVEREVAVHASEARATTRAIESLADEIRELRSALARRR